MTANGVKELSTVSIYSFNLSSNRCLVNGVSLILSYSFLIILPSVAQQFWLVSFASSLRCNFNS